MAQAAKKIEAQIVPLKEVILFISRPNIRPLLKQELKASGIETIFTVEDHDTCIEQMILNSSAMLIIGTDHDAVVLNSILTAAKGSFNVDTRPILLITQDMSPSVIS
jgi:hypothetical protein